ISNDRNHVLEMNGQVRQLSPGQWNTYCVGAVQIVFGLYRRHTWRVEPEVVRPSRPHAVAGLSARSHHNQPRFPRRYAGLELNFVWIRECTHVGRPELLAGETYRARIGAFDGDQEVIVPLDVCLIQRAVDAIS